MPATKGSGILTTRSQCHHDNDSSRSSGLRLSLSRILTSRSRSEVGPMGQPAEQSVLLGQLANHSTFAAVGQEWAGCVSSRAPCRHKQYVRFVSSVMYGALS